MDKDGGIVETHGNRQYQVRVDESSGITLRNRRFLHKIYLVMDGPPPATPEASDPSTNLKTPQEQTPEEPMDIKTGYQCHDIKPTKRIRNGSGNTTDVVGSNTRGYIQQSPTVKTTLMLQKTNAKESVPMSTEKIARAL